MVRGQSFGRAYSPSLLQRRADQVMNAFYRGTLPACLRRQRAAHRRQRGLTLSDWRGFFGSLRYRHTSNYRLDGEDPAIPRRGSRRARLQHDEEDTPLGGLQPLGGQPDRQALLRDAELLRVAGSPVAPLVARIHGTPGYSRGFTAGLTFHYLVRSSGARLNPVMKDVLVSWSGGKDSCLALDELQQAGGPAQPRC